MTEREKMDVDVAIVGAGPAGLCAAIRLRQLAADRRHAADDLRHIARVERRVPGIDALG